MRPHWDAKAHAWEEHLPTSDLFAELLTVVMDAAQPKDGEVVLDLGAGSGFLAIPFAERAGRVYAVDHSQKMLDVLRDKLGRVERPVVIQRTDLRRFHPAEPVEIIVSNYALHHLRHRAKRRLLTSCFAWTRPGGRIVIADIMVPLTLRPGQSAPLVGKLWSIASRGVPGYWRIVKNGVRWVFGRGEYPMALSTWTDVLRDAGFRDVGGRPVGRESGVAWGTRPDD